MVIAYRVSKGDKVLLLGEGNFSFCKDFIIFNENLQSNEICTAEIVATCRENQAENFSKFKQDNINFILSKGVTVHYNVDATNLKCQNEIKDQKYDKIIFNFPHVGGKMRLDLNRKLLKDFFSSACDVLSEEGCVVVALCDGQGGTEADKKQRSWNDSWQVSEMAAQSDLILFNVEPFDVTSFPNYVNVGYRSCEKSFHYESAVVHLFRRHQPPRILQEDPERWTNNEGNIVKTIPDALENYLSMPWSNPLSASSYLFHKLLEKLSVVSNVVEHKSTMRYSLKMTSYYEKPSIVCQDNILSLMDIFTSMNAYKESTGDVCMIARGLATKESFPLKEFSSPPASCQVFIFGSDVSTLLHHYLTDLLDLFGSPWKVSSRHTDELLLSSFTLEKQDSDQQCFKQIIESVFLPNGVPCHVIHIDDLAQLLFQIKDWRSLWDGKVDSSPDKPKFYPTVMFPKDYSFDLGLSVPLQIKDGFESNFYQTLWLLAGDIVVKVEHLTTYEPMDRELICYCYRITYKCYNAPLYRKRVIHFHEKIIAKVVARTLQVNIT